MLTRRGLITGLASLVAAPAVVRVASIMPVRAMPSEGVLAEWIRRFPPHPPWHDQCSARDLVVTLEALDEQFYVPMATVSWGRVA